MIRNCLNNAYFCIGWVLNQSLMGRLLFPCGNLFTSIKLTKPHYRSEGRRQVFLTRSPISYGALIMRFINKIRILTAWRYQITTPGVPDWTDQGRGRSGERTGAQSVQKRPGCTAGLPGDFNFVNRVPWMPINILNLLPIRKTENWIHRMSILGENTII